MKPAGATMYGGSTPLPSIGWWIEASASAVERTVLPMLNAHVKTPMKGLKMQITNENVGEAVVVRFDGRLDTSTASDTLAHFDALVEDGQTLIVADFSSVDFVSSAGLRVLLATAKNIGSSGSLRLFGLNPSVREVFDVSGFSTILAIFDDEASALAD